MKYELTNETIDFDGRVLSRIVALKSFSDVQEGSLGGYVETDKNLSQDGDCWIYGDAKVYSQAFVTDNAKISGVAVVRDFACVSGEAIVNEQSVIEENGYIKDNCIVSAQSVVRGEAALPVIHITGLEKPSITITDTEMIIECERHSLATWFAFTDEHLARMNDPRSVDLWRRYRYIILGICKNTGRVPQELE